MRILIISYLFSPMNVIGAIRWTKLAKYLSVAGHDVDVLTTSAEAPKDMLLVHDEQAVSRVVRIDHRNHAFDKTTYMKDNVAAAGSAPSAPKPFSRRLKDAVWNCRLFKYPTSLYVAWQNHARSKDFCRQAKKYIRNADMSQYDAVICTYGPTCGSMMGIWLKKRYPEIPLIMDFRDQMANPTNPWPFGSIFRTIQKKACAAADRIVCVTDGIVPAVCGEKYTAKCTVIPNGFDPEDFEDSENIGAPEKYRIVYTGSMYGGKADFSPLFKAVRELIDGGVIDRERIEFVHVGADAQKMAENISKFGLEDILVSYGKLPRREAIGWQRSARLLTMYVWNDRNYNGILSGKFIEYMNSGKPVVSVVIGDEGQSTIRTATEKGRLGIAYENMTAQVDYPAIRDYIAADYKRWEAGMEPDFHPDREYIDSFSYPALARRVEALVEKVSQRKDA